LWLCRQRRHESRSLFERALSSWLTSQPDSRMPSMGTTMHAGSYLPCPSNAISLISIFPQSTDTRCGGPSIALLSGLIVTIIMCATRCPVFVLECTCDAVTSFWRCTGTHSTLPLASNTSRMIPLTKRRRIVIIYLFGLAVLAICRLHRRILLVQVIYCHRRSFDSCPGLNVDGTS